MNLTNYLFIDIETASKYKTLEEYPQVFQDIHKKKEYEFDKAPLSPVFGKIVAVAIGILIKKMDGSSNPYKLKVITYADDDEKLILEFVNKITARHSTKNLCAHNGKGFDYPFIGMRMLKHRIVPPTQLNTIGKKPWEINLEDSMDWLGFGKWKNRISMAEATAHLNIPTPKDDIDGSQVNDVYWEGDLDRIETYVGKDVIALVNLALVVNCHSCLQEEDIEVIYYK